jgi:hypothetical protein
MGDLNIFAITMRRQKLGAGCVIPKSRSPLVGWKHPTTRKSRQDNAQAHFVADNVPLRRWRSDSTLRLRPSTLRPILLRGID